MIDLHSDTIYALWNKGDNGENLLSNKLVLSKDRLLNGGITGQCFALFTPLKEGKPWKIVNELHDRFLRETALSGIPVYTGSEDLRTGLHAILTTEEGGSIEGDISRLEILKSWNVKIFGFTWNYENELGYPNSTDPEVMNKPLKDKGIEALYECERLGIIADVSHLNDGGFYSIAEHAKKPFIATHSDCRAITDVTRNLKDDQIKIIADKGGVVGFNICWAFLEREGTPERTSRIADMAAHIMHMYEVGGEDVLAFGSDFDGTGGKLELDSPEKIPLVKDALKKEGLSERIIDKLFLDNALRVLGSC